jgi:hypothetical protein
VPRQLVFAFEVVVGQRCCAAIVVGRNGTDVEQRQRLLVGLGLAKVMLVGARDRVNEALVREHKRRPAIVGVLAEPLCAGAKLAVVLLLVELGAALTLQEHGAGKQVAALAARILARRLDRQLVARVVPMVAVRAGLRRAARQILGERAVIVDLQRALGRIVDQPALERLAELRLDNRHAALANRHRRQPTGVAAAVVVVAKLHDEHVADKQLAHRFALEARQARVALRRHVEARRTVATAHVARIVLARAEAHRFAVEARRAVATANVAQIRSIAVAHAARIAYSRAVWHARTILARRTVAATNVAHVVLYHIVFDFWF